MQGIVAQAMQAGALGFSTANTIGHRDSDGHPTYARLVSANELFAIGDAVGDAGHGVLQLLNDFYQETAQDFPVLVEWARRSQRPLSFTLEQDDSADTTFWRAVLDGVAAATAKGVKIRPQVAAKAVGAIFSLSATVNPLINRLSYFAIAALPLDEKVRIMGDPDFRARVLAEPPMKIAGWLPSVSPRIDDDFVNMTTGVKQLFVLDDEPDFEQPREQSLWSIAHREKRDVFELAYDALLRDGGRGLIFSPIANYADGNFDAVRAMLDYPDAILGLGDAGAHAKYICDGSNSTYILSYWVRDRTRGPRLSMERAVQLQTTKPAEHLGLADRGRIAVGAKADISVIDAGRIGLGRPELVSDLPGGAARFLQRTEGYIATFVSGTRIVDHDKLTGARPGRLVPGVSAG
jgi:N-acyl-D-aspartate/D-glutamate deacylase